MRTPYFMAALALMCSFVLGACQQEIKPSARRPRASGGGSQTAVDAGDAGRDAASDAARDATLSDAMADATGDADTGDLDSGATMPSLLEALEKDPDSRFSVLLGALESAGLTSALSGSGPLTVFAPTNAAFEALPAGELEELLDPDNSDILTGIMTFHLVDGRWTAEELFAASEVRTRSGLMARVEGDVASSLVYGGAAIVESDFVATNGVLHVLGAVASHRREDPSDLDAGTQDSGDSGQASDVGDANNPPDADDTGAGSGDTGSDADASQDVDTGPALPNLYEVAWANGNFTRFLNYVSLLNLRSRLEQESAGTLFAPTDTAIERFTDSGGRLGNFSDIERMIFYHMVSGRLRSSQFVDGEVLPTLYNGLSVTMHVGPQGAAYGEAPISITDLEASNGLLHGLDELQLPPGL